MGKSWFNWYDLILYPVGMAALVDIVLKRFVHHFVLAHPAYFLFAIASAGGFGLTAICRMIRERQEERARLIRWHLLFLMVLAAQVALIRLLDH